MKKNIATSFVLMMLVLSVSTVYAADADNPYTVNLNYIVGQDTSFTVDLAGAETTIDFNPVTINDKELEPDSQNAGSNIPIVNVTNTGNVNLDFVHFINTSQPSWVEVSFNNAGNTVDWTKTLNETSQNIGSSVATGGSVSVYMWANFTTASAGTTQRLYQVNSSAS